MRKSVLLCACILTFSCTNTNDTAITGTERLSVKGYNIHYISNKEPLQPQQFIKLPAGSIQAEGWLKKQLELQRDGLNGHLSEISAWLQKEDNAWLTSGGKWGWEEVPYWLRGYGNLAYALDDRDMIKEASFRIEHILKSQGTESCGFVEQMASDEIMLLITGDPYRAEHCEDVAFNSYPASMMPDYKSLRYITSPNHVISDSESRHSPIRKNKP